MRVSSPMPWPFTLKLLYADVAHSRNREKKEYYAVNGFTGRIYLQLDIVNRKIRSGLPLICIRSATYE